MAGAFRLIQMNEKQPSETVNGGCLRCKRMDVGQTPNPLGDRHTFVGFGSDYDCLFAEFNHGEIVICHECLIEGARFIGMIPKSEADIAAEGAAEKLAEATQRELRAEELETAARRVFGHFGPQPVAGAAVEEVATLPPAAPAAPARRAKR